MHRLVYAMVVLLFLVVVTESRREHRHGTQPKIHDSGKNCSAGMLNRQELKQCQLDSLRDVVEEGIQMALKHCHNQFIDRRWGCSGLSVSKVLEREGILKADIRESAFVYAITSAAVSYKMTEQCLKGNLDKCLCLPDMNHTTSDLLDWYGKCVNFKDFLKYGEDVSRWYLDPRKREREMHSLLVRHNNEAGRKALKRSIRTNCKYIPAGFHSYKLCWRELPTFTKVAEDLRDRFDRSLHVRANKKRLSVKASLSKRPPPKRELVYTKRSPNFCEADLTLGTTGSRGRMCKKSSKRSGDCEIMCCGRGFTSVERSIKVKCVCKFTWCCEVHCEVCEQVVIEHRCK